MLTAGVGKRTRWAWWVGTWFGAGWLKPGPGTYGSVAAMVLWVVAAHVWGGVGLAVGTAVAACLATAVGIPAATIVARESGREDPGFVVVDEVAGQWIALIGVRADWEHALVALALFRLFDIWKPWPVRLLERLPGWVGDHAGRCGGGGVGAGGGVGGGKVGLVCAGARAGLG
jgi:phosphatidylglycerophosphatase A